MHEPRSRGLELPPASRADLLPPREVARVRKTTRPAKTEPQIPNKARRTATSRHQEAGGRLRTGSAKLARCHDFPTLSPLLHSFMIRCLPGCSLRGYLNSCISVLSKGSSAVALAASCGQRSATFMAAFPYGNCGRRAQVVAWARPNIPEPPDFRMPFQRGPSDQRHAVRQ